MSDIKSNRELWGVDFPVGGEWDAGYTAPAVQAGKQGRWTVRRAPHRGKNLCPRRPRK